MRLSGWLVCWLCIVVHASTLPNDGRAREKLVSPVQLSGSVLPNRAENCQRQHPLATMLPMDKKPYCLITDDALNALRNMPNESVHCCVTSPPYWQLRDYGMTGQIGLEKTLDAYIQAVTAVFREVKRVLRADGTLWLNLGDTYATNSPRVRDNEFLGDHPHHKSQADSSYMLGTLKDKDLVGVPWRVAFALQSDGWYLRSDIIWHKPNPLPESIKDRPTKAHEYVFLLSKSPRYYYDVDAIREPHLDASLRKRHAPWKGKQWRGTPHGDMQNLKPAQLCHPLGKNKRDVWTIPVYGFKGAHFSTFPERLVEPCVLAGSPKDGVVLDPFAGSGTTLIVAVRLGRRAIGIELKKEYAELARERLNQVTS
jgi:DNA modification methylase